MVHLDRPTVHPSRAYCTAVPYLPRWVAPSAVHLYALLISCSVSVTTLFFTRWLTRSRLGLSTLAVSGSPVSRLASLLSHSTLSSLRDTCQTLANQPRNQTSTRSSHTSKRGAGEGSEGRRPLVVSIHKCHQERAKAMIRRQGEQGSSDERLE